MADEFSDLIERVWDLTPEKAWLGPDFVPKVIQRGRLFAELLGKVGRFRWLLELQRAGFLPRCHTSYLRVGRSWWATEAPAPEVLELLPHNVYKLAWLCRLPPEQLRALLAEVDCRQASVARVAREVRKRLGVPAGGTPAVAPAVKSIRGDLDAFAERTLVAVDALEDGYADRPIRAGLKEELKLAFDAILDSL